MPTAVIALPDRDFDPTEAAVPWHVLREAGVDVLFATEAGAVAACDEDMLEGVLFRTIRATEDNRAHYAAMAADANFLAPMRYAAIDPTRHDLLVLPGGHAQGMKQYLESEVLQERVVAFFQADQPVGAICHGTVVLARAVDAATQRSVLAGRAATCLPWRMEWSAWLMTSPTRGNYFRTYPEWVQSEVRRAMGDDGRFDGGPLVPSYGKPFTVLDGKLLTARWPGDASKFAEGLVALLQRETAGTATTTTATGTGTATSTPPTAG